MSDRKRVGWGAKTIGLLWWGIIPVVAGAQQPTAVPPITPALVFDRVTVVDVEQGKLVPGQRVVIVGNRIQAVGNGATVQTPARAQVVDARGKYLIPGLWDLHAHLATPPVPAYVQIKYAYLLANGVTGLRDAGSPGSEGPKMPGIPLQTFGQWRREILAGTRLGPPRQLFSGPWINGGVKPSGRFTKSNGLGLRCSGPDRSKAFACVADSADARHLVDSLAAAGADIIKMYNLSRAMYLALADAARRVGVLFGGHAGGLPVWDPAGGRQDSMMISVREASENGARIVDHALNSSGGLDTLCFFIDSAAPQSSASVDRCRPIAEQLRRTGTWAVPTIYLGEVALSLGGAKRTRRFDLRIAERVGLPLMAGSDMTGWPKHAAPGAGFSLHSELAAAVRGGLSPLAALQMGTLNPAKALRATDSLGTVAAGKLADLVLLDADPLTNIANTTRIRAVVANGRYFDRATLDRLLAATRQQMQEALAKDALATPKTP